MMDANAPLPDGYSWQGSLDETDIRALYAACHSLRFSGRLQLKDGALAAEVQFVAGEPIEIDGGDTQRIALWASGTFRAVQAIPSLAGDLTSARELVGSLSATKPSALWAWISEYRLTCEIELERPGGRAVVTFQSGHAEQASVNGMPELAALARVSSWTDGTFKVRLKPLFIDGVIPVAPPMPESAPLSGPQQFDVSRSIPMDLKHKAGPPPVPPLLSRAATPPLGELAQRQVEIGRPDGEHTSRTQPAAADLFGDGAPSLKRKSRAGLIVGLMLAIALAGGAGAAYYFHLPPFSPPPRPVLDAPPKTEAKADDKAEAKTDDKAEAKTDDKAEAKTDDKAEAKADDKTEAKTDDKVDEKKDHANRERADKLVAKARTLLIEGHEHTALDLFRKAEKLQPKNEGYRVFEQQALGKLGRAELVIEGKGTVTVDGHRFAAPRKVKVTAGPHTVDSADGEGEVTLKRGEKKKLRGKKG